MRGLEWAGVHCGKDVKEFLLQVFEEFRDNDCMTQNSLESQVPFFRVLSKMVGKV